MRRIVAVCALGCMLLTGCGPIGFSTGAGAYDADAEQVTFPPKPETRTAAEDLAEKAGLNEETTLMGLTYRVDSSWDETEVDNSSEGQMISRIYKPAGSGAALDIMAKGISLIERDALAEGKRSLGSVGQFTKQWESTYGITLTQDIGSDELPDGADMGWFFASLGTGRGGQGIILIADMYMYAVYYAAEDAQNNPFRDIWPAITGCLEVDPPHEDS